MTASLRVRSTVLAAACLGHVGLILLISSSSEVSRRRAPGQEQEPLVLVFLDDLLKPEPLPRQKLRQPPRPSAEPAPLPQASLEPDAADFAPSPPVSESVPSIDWAAEAGRAAGAAIDGQLAAEAKREDPSDRITRHGKGVDLPPPIDREHKFGDTEQYEGGDTITWISKRCYYTTAQPVIPNYFNMMMPVCKPRSHSSTVVPIEEWRRKKSELPLR